MKVSDLIEKLKALPQDKELFCQVVPVEPNAGAWGMAFDVVDLPISENMAVLSISHPFLLRLTPEVVWKS